MFLAQLWHLLDLAPQARSIPASSCLRRHQHAQNVSTLLMTPCTTMTPAQVSSMARPPSFNSRIRYTNKLIVMLNGCVQLALLNKWTVVIYLLSVCVCLIACVCLLACISPCMTSWESRSDVSDTSRWRRQCRQVQMNTMTLSRHLLHLLCLQQTAADSVDGL